MYVILSSAPQFPIYGRNGGGRLKVFSLAQQNYSRHLGKKILCAFVPSSVVARKPVYSLGAQPAGGSLVAECRGSGTMAGFLKSMEHPPPRPPFRCPSFVFDFLWWHARLVHKQLRPSPQPCPKTKDHDRQIQASNDGRLASSAMGQPVPMTSLA